MNAGCFGKVLMARGVATLRYTRGVHYETSHELFYQMQLDRGDLVTNILHDHTLRGELVKYVGASRGDTASVILWYTMSSGQTFGVW